MEQELTLMKHLQEQTREKSCFSLRELKRTYPKDKEQITTLVFCGLIEPVSTEYPDTVRALIFPGQD